MRRRLAALAVLSALAAASNAQAATTDPVGDLISSVISGALPGTGVFNVKATLYHAGAKGVGALDSLGCKVVPMRTIAVDKSIIPRRTVIFIKETVGLKMPNGATHDGYWYATDIGSGIKGQRIDLYTGHGAASMKPMQALNLGKLTAVKVGKFEGCPPN
ncbi:3D domain-containing protein [Phenylobacterium sp.]|uniref:3D domain-containing protein n=1 Tax=Phenylobacterium sp. TaxID=1871053 RepID=UPI0025FA649A|nr:3D domain-containing protein [Phenylobacterium sp.]